MNVQSGAQAVQVAKQWLGTPYCWGGGHGGPVPIGTCVDCSGLVNQVFGITGVTQTQSSMGSPVSGIASAGPGDLIFFGPLAPNEAYHVGIYIGMGLMIDAPHTGSVVRQDTVAGFGSIDAIRRLVPTTPDSGPGANTGPITYNYAQLEGVWIMAGGSAQNAPMAAAIAMAESGGNSQASGTNSNNTTDRGLWQINSSNGSGSSFDVMTNARAAVQMSNNGTNWRPWCTAYSDGACGTKGGCYQCPGSPYMKFLNPGVAPDMTAPINATNAATGSGGTATDMSFLSNMEGSTVCAIFPWMCSGSNPVTGFIATAIEGVLRSVLNPLIQIVAGVMGITAGAAMMGFGIYMMVQHTQAGQQATSALSGAGRTGIMAVAPESAPLVAASSSERTAARRGQTSMALMQGRQQQLTQSHQQRMQQMNTKQQIDWQAREHAEHLRRTRPPRGNP